VRNTGVRVFSHADPEDRTPLPLAGGESAAALLPLLTAPGALLHDRAGLISLVALPDTPPPPPKERVVAMGGQLRTIKEAAPPGPNGTGFNITLAPAPALDGTAVVVGRVLEGEAVLQALAALPTNRNADEAGLFFAVAKSIGDKRAVVAEKGFGKPLAKVSVAKSGAL
jgi:peptidyl-prolyl cis-trans isomerase B (cyclophilin B)